MRFSPGANVERYQIRSLLGWGGMAEVWEVRHRQLGTRHALKVLVQSGSSQRARLLREGETQARLSHPNLLPVQEILEVDGVLGLLMPLVDGPSMAELLEHTQPTQAEAFALIRAVCAGVAAAHAAGLVHRDLKPANVLLDLTDGIVPRVGDFGLVKGPDLGARLTGSLGVLGTPTYMSPEQLRRARDVDVRSDLWSLGVMLCELLTGSLPFRADSIPALIEAHQRPPVLTGVDGQLDGVLRALLQVDPRARLPSCETLLSCLDALSPPTEQDALSADAPLMQAARSLQRERIEAAEVPTLHNLPSRRDDFIGRDVERAELRQAFTAGARLVTVTGAGGVGKTRLVLEFSEAAAYHWPEGIWLCELVDVRSLEALSETVSATLGLTLSGADTLGAALASRGRALLVLDNVEQLTGGALEAIEGWLADAPALCVLATSRQPLKLTDEVRLSLGPLAVPAAISLFVDRVQAVRPGFVLSDDNRDDLIALVTELGALPLAIELAASRARRLSPSRLLTRLSDRFALLRNDSSDRPLRQRSLYATLQWSWELLTESERALLMRCGELEEGFGLLDVSQPERSGLLTLAEKSLLAREGEGATVRFRMPINVRQFVSIQK